MPTYINSYDSLSACGAGDDLHFDSAGYTSVPVTENLRVPFFAMRNFAVDNSFERLSSTLINVTQNLLKDSGLSKSELADTALIVGSTSLDVGTIKPDPEKEIWLSNADKLSEIVQQHFALSELHFTLNTACTASVNALILADQLIDQGKAKHVIVIGCEFYNPLTLNGFSSLDLISSGQLMTFSTQRSGLILGEGIGALLLSADRPSGSCLKIVGSGSGCDHHSLTTTQESGDHIADVIRQCLNKASLAPQDIDLIKVHGTATLNNDEAEANAFAQVLDTLPIFALKPFTGHTLGACGALEIAIMSSLLKTQTTLPVPAYARDAGSRTMMDFVADKTLSDFKYVLVNHCGFGGNNAALLMEVISN